jgi:hypothetical protein
VEIRDLLVPDVFTVGRIIAKAGKDARSQLSSTKEPAEALFAMLSGVMGAEDDVSAWLADMAGMTVEELKAQPATAILDIVEGISEKPGARDFFARASALAQKWMTAST